MSINLDNFLHDALDRVEHTTTIDAFYHQFKAIKSLISSCQPEIPEPYFASRFVYGLKEEFQSFVFRFQPTTVTAAYRLACIYEESIYLQFFPELVCQQADLFVENNVIGNHLVVPGVDRVSEVIMGEDISSECDSVIDRTGSNQRKDDVIDILVDGSIVIHPNQDTPDSLEVSADQLLDSVSSKMAYQQSMSTGECDPLGFTGTFVHLPVVQRVSADEESVEQYQAPEDTCQNELELFVIKEAKVHPPDVAITFVDSNWCSAVYLPRKNNGGNDTITVILAGVSALLRVGVMIDYPNVGLLETIAANLTCVMHFRFHWEPGPLVSQWKVDIMSYSDSRQTNCSWEPSPFLTMPKMRNYTGLNNGVKAKLVHKVVQLSRFGSMGSSQVFHTGYLIQRNFTEFCHGQFSYGKSAIAQYGYAYPLTKPVYGSQIAESMDIRQAIRSLLYDRYVAQKYIIDVFSLLRDFDMSFLDHLITESWVKNMGRCSELNVCNASDGYSLYHAVGNTEYSLTVLFYRYDKCISNTRNVAATSSAQSTWGCRSDGNLIENTIVGTTVTYLLQPKYCHQTQLGNFCYFDMILSMLNRVSISGLTRSLHFAIYSSFGIAVGTEFPEITTATWLWQAFGKCTLGAECTLQSIVSARCNSGAIRIKRTLPHDVPISIEASIMVSIVLFAALSVSANVVLRILTTIVMPQQEIVVHIPSADTLLHAIHGRTMVENIQYSAVLLRIVELVFFSVETQSAISPAFASAITGNSGQKTTGVIGEVGLLNILVYTLQPVTSTRGFHGPLKVSMSELQHGHIVLSLHIYETQYTLQLRHKYRLVLAYGEWVCLLYWMCIVCFDLCIVSVVTLIDHANGFRLHSFWRVRSEIPDSAEMSMKQEDITGTQPKSILFNTIFLPTNSIIPSMKFPPRGIWLFDPGIDCRLLVNSQFMVVGAGMHAIQFAHFNTSKWTQIFLVISGWPQSLMGNRKRSLQLLWCTALARELETESAASIQNVNAQAVEFFHMVVRLVDSFMVLVQLFPNAPLCVHKIDNRVMITFIWQGTTFLSIREYHFLLEGERLKIRHVYNLSIHVIDIVQGPQSCLPLSFILWEPFIFNQSVPCNLLFEGSVILQWLTREHAGNVIESYKLDFAIKDLIIKWLGLSPIKYLHCHALQGTEFCCFDNAWPRQFVSSSRIQTSGTVRPYNFGEMVDHSIWTIWKQQRHCQYELNNLMGWSVTVWLGMTNSWTFTGCDKWAG